MGKIIMARISNEELGLMSINELEKYAQEHPAEAGRISRILAKSSAKLFKVSIKYNVSGNLEGLVQIGLIEPI